jgi:uncharacterized protein
MKVLLRSLGFLTILFVSLISQAEVAVPPLTARVIDLTQTLTPSQRETLEHELQTFEKRKGSQIAVLIVATTQPEEIEQYSMRVAESWKLGRKGVDDGVLLLVAKDDRSLRIEVGYGLEGVIPDAIAKRVVSEIIVPYLKQGDFYGGIHAGVNRLVRLIDGEPLPPPEARDRSWSGFQDLLPFGFIAVLIGGGLLRALFGRLVGAGVASSIIGVVAWVMLGALLPALVAAFIVFLFVLMAGTRMGPGGVGGGLGGGLGGGGFGGGGGGFGGGGASGKW